MSGNIQDKFILEQEQLCRNLLNKEIGERFKYFNKIHKKISWIFITNIMLNTEHDFY